MQTKMNPANIVQCLSELVTTKLKLHPTTIPHNEREMAQHLFETITSLNTCKQYKYEEELHEGMKFLTIFELEK